MRTDVFRILIRIEKHISIFVLTREPGFLYFPWIRGKRGNMKIHHILERGTARINEDCLVIEDNIFGVFDGATSLDRQTFEQGKTGGMIASQTARSVFRKNHYPLGQLARKANQEIMNQMIRHGVDISRKESLWSTSAAVVRVKERVLEWVRTGDAVILLVYEDGSHRVLADREDHDHETLTLWKDMVEDRIGTDPAGPGRTGSGTGDRDRALPPIHQALAGQIQKVRSGMNITYGVLNGEKEAEPFLYQGTESLDRVRDVLLFTDGLSLPRETPEKKRDFTSLVKDYLLLGLEGLKTKIREKEKKDPFCLAFPRFKCHDDIAAIAITF